MLVREKVAREKINTMLPKMPSWLCKLRLIDPPVQNVSGTRTGIEESGIACAIFQVVNCGCHGYCSTA